jgi:RNA-directed DNA polymerase
MYWASRLSKGYGDISPSKALILKRQNRKCIYCKETFKNEEVIEIHHIKFKKNGGDSKYSNLSAIHNHCHDQYHAQETISRIESGRLPGEVKSSLGF